MIYIDTRFSPFYRLAARLVEVQRRPAVWRFWTSETPRLRCWPFRCSRTIISTYFILNKKGCFEDIVSISILGSYFEFVRRESNDTWLLDTPQDLEVFCTSYIKIVWRVFFLEFSKVLILRVFTRLFEIALYGAKCSVSLWHEYI